MNALYARRTDGSDPHPGWAALLAVPDRPLDGSRCLLGVLPAACAGQSEQVILDVLKTAGAIDASFQARVLGFVSGAAGLLEVHPGPGAAKKDVTVGLKWDQLIL